MTYSKFMGTDTPKTAPVRNILLIEDNPGQAYVIERMLSRFEEARFKVKAVERLAAGMSQLRQAPFDAVLLDLNLPDSQGLETVKNLRQKAPQVPVLVLTTLDSHDNAPQALELGAQDYLIKWWVDDHALGRAILRQIERARPASPAA